MVEQLSAGRMPLSPVTMDPNDRETLLAWLRAGAPAIAPDACFDAGVPPADAGESADATLDAGEPDAAEAPDADVADAELTGDAEEGE